MAASGFIKVCDERLIAERAVQQVCFGGTDEEPTVELHLSHGVETFTGEEAKALAAHFGHSHKKAKGGKHAHA